MYTVIVTCHLKPERVDEFKAAILANARGTRKEAGNLRFDVVQGVDDPTRFQLIEVYRTPEDFKTHQQQPHYLSWRDAVVDWMAQLRSSTKSNAVFFGDAEVGAMG